MSTSLMELPKGRLAGPSLLPENYSGWDELAEQSVLGALLLLPNLADELFAAIETEDFFSSCHQQIFLAAKQLRAAGSSVDLVTVGATLAGHPDFEGRGGRGYLAALPAMSVPALNAPQYARIVRALSIQRQARVIGHALYEGQISPADAQEALLGLRVQETAGDLPTISAVEFCRQVPEEPEWIVEGYLARGTITELDAKIKTGKTHFATDLIRAILAREEFLGQKTVRTPVLYLSEERQTTFRAALKRVGLENETDLHLVFRQEVRTSWPEVGRAVVARAKDIGIGLVVVDTLSDWSGLAADKENDAGAALEAMRPLQAMAAAHLAVMANRHERKSGGEVGESARGSSAFGGAADILLSLRKDPSLGHANRRVLEGIGRLQGALPKLILEMTDGHYRSLGTSTQVETRKARELLLEILPEAEDQAFTEGHILEQAAEQVSRSTLKRVIDSLVEEGAISKRKGAGSASARAYGFWMSEEARL